MRIASYNVHACIGRDLHHDAGRVMQVIRQCDADLVALQEVEQRSGSDDLAHLARQDGYLAVAGPTWYRGPLPFGNLLLSRVPVRQVRRHDLSTRNREKRGAIEAFVPHDGGIRLIATHLGLSHRERRHQFARLLSLLEEPTAAAVTVLAGDFNVWSGLRHPLALLTRRFGARLTRHRTFPAHRPLLALDRIFVRPGTALKHTELIKTPTAREASDHLPLIAEIDPAISAPRSS